MTTNQNGSGEAKPGDQDSLHAQKTQTASNNLTPGLPVSYTSRIKGAIHVANLRDKHETLRFQWGV